MKNSKRKSYGIAMAIPLLCGVSAMAASPQPQPYHEWAKTPPLGWNSWDCFGTTVTELQTKEQADAMAEKLLPAGYNILTVDIQWYEPESKAHYYKPDATLEMDKYGRLTPGLKKFPSAANGNGFKNSRISCRKTNCYPPVAVKSNGCGRHLQGHWKSLRYPHHRHTADRPSYRRFP